MHFKGRKKVRLLLIGQKEKKKTTSKAAREGKKYAYSKSSYCMMKEGKTIIENSKLNKNEVD